ncbi:MAG: LTA synthase family protein, partial [Bacteroidota bacterium]
MVARLKQLMTGKFAPVILLMLVAAAISLITRIVLLIYSHSSFDFTFLNIVGVFGIGLFYDLCMSSYLIIPLVLHIWFTNEKMYSGTGMRIAIGVYIVLIVAFSVFNIIPKEFN